MHLNLLKILDKNLKHKLLSSIQTAIALVAVTTISSAVQASTLQDARSRIDALTEAQITSAVTSWLRAQNAKCRVQLTDNTQAILKSAVDPVLFEQANVEVRHQGELTNHLNNRLDKTLEVTTKAGMYSITQSNGASYVTARDCK